MIACQELEQLRRRALLGVGRTGLGGQRGCSRPELFDPIAELRLRRHLEVELAPGRAQRLVDARKHPSQPVASVGREELETLRLVSGAKLRERLVEGFRAEHRRLGFVELAEAWVEPGREWVRLEQARAETVNRRDPGAVELAREVVPSTLGKRGADPRPQLAGGTTRVRDHEDRVDVEPAIADRADDPLDEHRGLAGTGTGGDEHLSPGLDCRKLLIVHARSIRQIGQRSHQLGHSPPRGSWRTSPVFIRSASAVAVPRADSTRPQNASSSR